MSVKRMIAIGAIFLLACVGWSILGTATAVRSTDFFSRLSSRVEALWGMPLVQEAPAVSVQVPGSDQVRWIMPSANRIKVELETDYRKKGLIWYPTYTCAFDGTYTVANAEDVAQKVRLHFNFPSKEGTYDNFSMAVAGKTLAVPVDTAEGIGEMTELAPGESRDIRITYKTRGIREWRYQLDRHVGRVQNLSMEVKAGFKAVDYPDGCLSPMSKSAEGEGMVLKWEATDLITKEEIGLVIPEKLNPGPVTSRITFFAPVCLFFFFVLIGTINVMYRVNIHPMHYLFVAAGFFAFHLLLAYMVGLVDINISFVVSAVTSVLMVTAYLAAALGRAFPWKVAAAGQLFFLVLFSYSFFFQGITGLTVAIGSVVTLGVLMRVTAHVDWSEVLRGRAKTAGKLPPPASETPPPLMTA